jgi:hypothetical protein
LGYANDTYLQFSTAIASKALGGWIDMVNTAQQEINDAYNRQRALGGLRAAVELAWDEMEKMEKMDLLADFRGRLGTNKSVISDLKYQLRNVDYTPIRLKEKSSDQPKKRWKFWMLFLLPVLPALL